MTANEIQWIALVNTVSFVVGAVYVFCNRKKTEILPHILMGAPFVSAFVQAGCIAISAITSGLLEGKDIATALAQGVGMGFFLGIGAAIYGIPGAVLGGFLAWALSLGSSDD